MITTNTVKRIIKKLLKGEDYRIEVVNLINEEFLKYAIEFFKKVAEAKLNNKNIDIDWYKKEMLKETLSGDEIAIHAGLNKKTITNMYNSARKEIIIDAAYKHYDVLYEHILELTKIEDVNITLSIKFNKVSVELDVNESLIVINSLAVKRSALRGGLWSSAGKQTETPLMLVLCKLYDVQSYLIKPKATKNKNKVSREADFFLISGNNKYRCEVKLMGKGNPESADVVIARNTKVFVADKLSEQNKLQLQQLNVFWLELRSNLGFRKFPEILDKLKIPRKNPSEKELTRKIDKVIEEVVGNLEY